MRRLVLVAAALAGVAACGPAGPSTEQRELRRDYVAYWDALLGANATADPDSAALAERAAGGQLVRVRDNIDRARARHVVARGSVGHDIRDVAIAGKLAYVVDCVDVDGWLQYDATTGAVQPDQVFDRPRQLARFTLAPRDGGWSVTDAQELGTC